MPTMQYTDPIRLFTVNKNFVTPVKVSDLWKGWYKTCKLLCPHIPDVPEYCGHFSTMWLCDPPPEVDVRWIKFTMVNRVNGQKVYLVIDRKGPSM